MVAAFRPAFRQQSSICSHARTGRNGVGRAHGPGSGPGPVSCSGAAAPTSPGTTASGRYAPLGSVPRQEIPGVRGRLRPGRRHHHQ